MIPFITNLIHTVTTQFSSNQFFSATVLGGGMVGIIAYFRHIPARIWDMVISRTTVTLHFNSTDPMYFYLQKWIAGHTHFDRFQKVYNVLSAKISASENPSYIEDKSDEEDAPTFVMAPWVGTYIIHYKNKWMKITCNRTDPTQAKIGQGVFVYESVEIAYLGRSQKPAQIFLEDIRTIYKEEKKKTVNIYIPGRNGGYWQEHNKLLHRSLESVVFRGDGLQTIVDNMTNFIKKDTETWYIDKGIPYHRGYLFQGPPGTGKTTTVYTIASHFKMNVYFMSISQNISDEDFFGLVGSVENNSILVMEDIDCIFDKERNKKEDIKVSFSSMLNALDGFCSKHGSIVILTTNHPERLNDALIRKGRIDMTVDFHLCDREQIMKMFLKFFPAKNIEASAFAKNFAEDMFSPVEIQEYLISAGNIDQALNSMYIKRFIERKNTDEQQKIKTVA